MGVAPSADISLSILLYSILLASRTADDAGQVEDLVLLDVRETNGAGYGRFEDTPEDSGRSSCSRSQARRSSRASALRML